MVLKKNMKKNDSVGCKMSEVSNCRIKRVDTSTLYLVVMGDWYICSFFHILIKGCVLLVKYSDLRTLELKGSPIIG